MYEYLIEHIKNCHYAKIKCANLSCSMLKSKKSMCNSRNIWKKQKIKISKLINKQNSDVKNSNKNE